MDFAETEERTLLRRSVAGIVSARSATATTPSRPERVAGAPSCGRRWPTPASSGSACRPSTAVAAGASPSWPLVCEECAAAGSPLLLLLVSPAICGAIIARFADDAEQKARWLPPFGDRRAKMAFAITEPDAGSNSHRISTAAVATDDGDVYRLSGTKYYISGVDDAEQVLVVTRTGTDQDTGRGRLVALRGRHRRARADGGDPIPVEIAAPEKQFTLFFDDVEVPAPTAGSERKGPA